MPLFAKDCLTLIPGVILAVELFLRLPFPRHFKTLKNSSVKAVKTISNHCISDHWKEKVIPAYAARIFSAAIMLLVLLTILLSAFAAAYGITGYLVHGNLSTPIDRFYKISMQVSALGLAMIYMAVRKKRQARDTRTSIQTGDTSLWSRTFHRMALGSQMLRETAFDIDCILAGAKPAPDKITMASPVFVTGLARSGTTLLLEILYGTGQFCTLTYRHMPFITAPYLWQKLAGRQGKKGRLMERAHGDGMMVNYDSPEAFEEVFWKMVSKDDYITETCLTPWVVNPRWTEKYRRFVNNIIKGCQKTKPDPGLRYLAKNNNNLLRITTLRAAFPEGIIVVPFRQPLAHAASLLRQHHRFLERHGQDKFALTYMNWLGHHEFGLHMKPFGFSPDGIPCSHKEAESLPYWLRYWQVVYAYLLDTHENQVCFFDYDLFCREPEHSLRALANCIKMEQDRLTPFKNRVRLPTNYGGSVGNAKESMVNTGKTMGNAGKTNGQGPPAACGTESPDSADDKDRSLPETVQTVYDMLTQAALNRVQL